MPERDELIAGWRHNMAESAGCSEEVLDELEAHLRDDLQQLVQAGHSEEEAFHLAVSRLGNPRLLAREFAKVTEPAKWLPVRFAIFAAVILAAILVGYLLGRLQDGRLELLLAAHVGAITLGYSAALLAGILVICYVAIRPFRDLAAGQMLELERAVFTLTAAGAVLTLLGVLLGCVWAKDHLGRYWDWDPKETWGMFVLVWDAAMLLLLALRIWGHRAMLLSILGNSVVGFAWIAGAPHLRYGLMIFALSQLFVFGLGFLPARCLRIRGA